MEKILEESNTSMEKILQKSDRLWTRFCKNQIIYGKDSANIRTPVDNILQNTIYGKDPAKIQTSSMENILQKSNNHL